VLALVLLGAVQPAAIGVASAQQSQPETDNTVTRIEVHANGSATWTLQFRTRLDTADRVAEYEAFQEQFRNDTGRYLDPFHDRMRGVVANAENATGREMTANGFRASTRIQEVPQRWGVVTYEFTWTNFAAQQDGTLAVGDVFQGGFFIAADDRLQVETPPGYETSRVEPDPDSREGGLLTWSGREDFADGQPTVEFEPTDSATTSEPGSPTAPTRSPGPGGLTVVAGLAVLALAAFLGVVLYRRREAADVDDQPAATATDTAPAQRDTDSGSTGTSQGEETPVLTDEERVVALLEEHGGRMRQAELTDEFDWSASKTSRLVGQLAEEGTVEKLRLGRENVVALPEDSE
jgi:hypothetical protein